MATLNDRGYLIPAINSDTTNYVKCAEYLADSIRYCNPTARISILTNDDCSRHLFDQVIRLPHGDCGGYANDWQCFEASPYKQTIKLEADMVAAGPVDHWWSLFEHRDVVISQGCRTIYDQPATSRHYRKFIDDNHLPDVYNAITYWRWSTVANDFFKLVRNIFENWNDYKKLVKFPEDCPSTDFVYAMAAEIMGPEKVTLPLGVGPTIVHMKQHIQPMLTDDWTQELLWEWIDNGLKIQTVAQHGFVHYHKKDWLTKQHE